MIVGMGMAEIVSAIPTSGGPYFWAAILAPPGHEVNEFFLSPQASKQASGPHDTRAHTHS